MIHYAVSFFTSLLVSSFLSIISYFLVKHATNEYKISSKYAYILNIIANLLIMPWAYYYGFLNIQFIFICALLITFFTDAQTRLISRFVTLFLVPCTVIAAYLDYLPITAQQSLVGAFFGFFILWAVSKIAFYITQQESMGQGDIDLLCFIGSFLGPIGMWYTLVIGALTGSLFGMACLALYGKKARSMPLPFGSFLSIGAIAVLYIIYGIIPTF
jgi:leader peptidase (prepilin peptidase) / N-methyltransferase